MLFAQSDGCSFFILAVVIGFLGEGVTHLTERIAALRQSIRRWAIGLGIASGTLFFVTGGARHLPASTDPLLSAIFASGLVALCAGLGWYLVVAVMTFVYQYVIASPFRLLGHWWRSSSEASARRQEENRRRREQEAYDRAAPERAKAAAMQATDKKRRADARAACELLYLKHAHVLNNRLSKETVQDFMARHMGDEHSAQHVEERGRQLQDLILQHINQIEPPKTPYTIETLTDWYKKTKKQIEDLSVDDRYKQAQLAQLNARFAELTQALMETLQP